MKNIQSFIFTVILCIAGFSSSSYAQTGWFYGAGGAFVATSLARPSSASSNEEDYSPKHGASVSGTTESWKDGIVSTFTGKIADKDVNEVIRTEARDYVVYDTEVKSDLLKAAIQAVRVANESAQNAALDEERIIAGIALGKYKFTPKEN